MYAGITYLVDTNDPGRSMQFNPSDEFWHDQHHVILVCREQGIYKNHNVTEESPGRRLESGHEQGQVKYQRRYYCSPDWQTLYCKAAIEPLAPSLSEQCQAKGM
jgi:hypothetical protein